LVTSGKYDGNAGYWKTLERLKFVGDGVGFLLDILATYSYRTSMAPTIINIPSE
jgi:hypothetical protein